MEKIAKKKVVIFTPNGFLAQGEYYNNPWQLHRSGWTAEEMKKRGYKVLGFGGAKILRPTFEVRFSPKKLWWGISHVTELFVRDLPNHYKNIELSEFVIMPNHVHGIIHIIENKITPAKPLSEVIRGFKTFSSRRINETNPKEKFQWQKSYYDRIIRNEREYSLIQTYILNNPRNWNDQLILPTT
jgi:REP element-mobilizing transposase RayT